MSEVFVGRQPIFDRGLETVGAELFYRDSEEGFDCPVDPNAASRSTVVTAFTEVGIDSLVGRDGIAYLNFAEQMLLSHSAEALPPSRVVIEVLQHVPATREVQKALQRLKDAGYAIALDDFIYTEGRAPLLRYADIVKIEVMDRIVMRQTLDALEPYDVTLLADKVEDLRDMRMCLELGFQLFQGYFLCRPDVVVGEKLSANRAATLELLSKLSDPTVEFGGLVELVTGDVSLTYRLLRYLNSAHFALRRPLTDTREAMGMLGYNKLRAWVCLVALSSVDDKPAELVRIGTVRARMCELLSATAGIDGPTAFTVGLFSVLDALFDRDMEELVGPLPLESSIKRALIDRTGELGELLACAERYESGDWDRLLESQFEEVELAGAFVAANSWTEEARRHL